MKKSFSKDSWHYHQDPISLFDFVAVPIQVLIESLQINRKKDSLTEAEYEKLDTELIAKYRERYQSLNDSSLVELFLLHAPDHKPEALAAMTLELDSRKILKPEPSQSTDTNSRPAYPVLSTKWYWACAKLGAVKIVAGIDEYSAWSSAMVRDYSETLRPHLHIIWHAAHRLAGMAKSIQREDMVLACQTDAYNELQEAAESGLVPSVMVNADGSSRVEIVRPKRSWHSFLGKITKDSETILIAKALQPSFMRLHTTMKLRISSIVLWAAVIIIFFMLLFPPWVQYLDIPHEIHLQHPHGYAFIFTPPVATYDKAGIMIDFTRLFLQILSIAVLATPLYLWLRSNEKSS